MLRIRPRLAHASSVCLPIVLVFALASPADAQLWKKVKEKAKEAANDAIRDKPKSAEAPTPAGKAEAAPAPSGAASTTPATGPAGEPGEGAWTRYDFVPGEIPLFAEDFSTDEVGDFPRRLTLKAGNMEVAELRGARYLRLSSPGELQIPLPRALPERFTLEFDYLGSPSEHQFVYFGRQPNAPFVLVRSGDGNPEGGIEVPGTSRFVSKGADRSGAFVPVRVMADGKHVKVYLGGTRVANVPSVELGRDRVIRIQVNAGANKPGFIGNIRVAAGGRRLYDALAESGRVATQGILFDTGSDRIRPESTPTLREIGEMLGSHPDLKLVIEGHTDNVGSAASNLALSGKRAAAVRAYLLEKHDVDAGRLTAKGLGASKPAAPNASAEGRQQNRRVELVRVP